MVETVVNEPRSRRTADPQRRLRRGRRCAFEGAGHQPRSEFVKTIALVGTCCALAACASNDDGASATRFSLANEPYAARHQLEHLVSPGTRQEVAAKIMTGMGFAVSVLHGPFGSESFADYLYCDYRENSVLVSRRWQAALVLKEGRVVDYRVATALIGP
jgi:hypothetical protein